MFDLSTEIGGALFTSRVSDRIARRVFPELVRLDPNCGCRHVESGLTAPPPPRRIYDAITVLLDVARGRHWFGLCAPRRLPRPYRTSRACHSVGAPVPRRVLCEDRR